MRRTASYKPETYIRFLHDGNTGEISVSSGVNKTNIIDFSSNVNPFSLPHNTLKVIRNCSKNLSHIRKSVGISYAVCLWMLVPGLIIS